uniref:BTB domain-containing protein n=1 Tax=Ditylenchus dipsaci TaxID=166011 RepID=A0A915EJQ3_9BILA
MATDMSWDDRFTEMEQSLKRLESTLQSVSDGVSLSEQKLQKVVESSNQKIEEIKNLLVEKNSTINIVHEGGLGGMIRMVFNVTKLSEATNQEIFSDRVEIADAKWRVGVDCREESINVHLICERKSTNITCDANFTILFFGKSGEVSKVGSFTFTGEDLTTKWGPQFLMSSDFFKNSVNGFIDSNGNSLLQAEIFVKTSDLRTLKSIEKYSSATAFYWDFVLVFGCHRLHVNKGLLSAHSEYFRDLFFENRDEFAIENVEVDDFVILLDYLYPSQNQGRITVGNVESLLKMADFFGIDDALIKIGSFLEACDISKAMTLDKKLLFAERYHLKTLKDACVGKDHSEDVMSFHVQRLLLKTIKKGYGINRMTKEARYAEKLIEEIDRIQKPISQHLLETFLKKFYRMAIDVAGPLRKFDKKVVNKHPNDDTRKEAQRVIDRYVKEVLDEKNMQISCLPPKPEKDDEPLFDREKAAAEFNAKSKEKVKPESKKPMGTPEAVAQVMTSSLTVVKQEVDKELPNKILFVSKLPDDADLEMLNSVFQPFAGFKEVRLVPNRTDTAFVEFKSEADSAAVRKALNNFQIKPAHEITVAYAMK